MPTWIFLLHNNDSIEGMIVQMEETAKDKAGFIEGFVALLSMRVAAEEDQQNCLAFLPDVSGTVANSVH